MREKGSPKGVGEKNDVGSLCQDKQTRGEGEKNGLQDSRAFPSSEPEVPL